MTVKTARSLLNEFLLKPFFVTSLITHLLLHILIVTFALLFLGAFVFGVRPIEDGILALVAAAGSACNLLSLRPSRASTKADYIKFSALSWNIFLASSGLLGKSFLILSGASIVSSIFLLTCNVTSSQINAEDVIARLATVDNREKALQIYKSAVYHYRMGNIFLCLNLLIYVLSLGYGLTIAKDSSPHPLFPCLILLPVIGVFSGLQLTARKNYLDKLEAKDWEDILSKPSQES